MQINLFSWAISSPKEIPSLIFGKLLVHMHVNKKILKATVLWSIITCLEMDKQNIQVEEVCSIAY